MTNLSEQEHNRYMRHLMLKEIGEKGQKKLKSARVVVVGAGGLGCPILMYLAAAGVGTIGIVDDDVVDESNLQRQILYSSQDVGKSKVEIAAQKILDMNPHIQVNKYKTRLNQQNYHQILTNYNIVVDGSDNFPTRYLVNDACVFLDKTLIYGSIFRFEGQVSVFCNSSQSPCYRCLYPEIPGKGAIPDCSQAGVIGVLPGIIAMFQATETLKYILQLGDSLSGKLLCFHALDMDMRKINIKKDVNCPACALRTIDINNYSYQTKKTIHDISCDGLFEELEKKNIKLVDVRQESEYQKQHIENSVLLPLSSIETNMPNWDKQQQLILYCYSGTRSQKALEIFREHGFYNVRSLEGGIVAWNKYIANKRN
ncbi:molybdopterin-synthase adenylyltransferase MoeB [Candidatus Uabimicrobium sp. HlEnr_7]|uniref:molybdopterin-synthase adenylyltransferase MoeB n=1 Tax=Candidatus Uabimicrobium helgolandensis TaxID=3095367 RepID=UPI0035573E40